MISPIPRPLLMQRLRATIIRNNFRTLLGQSMVRPLTVVLITLLIWALVFYASLKGFRFLRDDAFIPLRGEIVGILLDLLFLTLGALLVFTGGLILYGSLFTAPETAFLLCTPLADDRVFAYKFQTATAISIWAFLLLGGPILIAYGITCYAPWYYYVLLPLFFLGFVLLPASVSALVCLLIVNLLPRRRKQVLIVCIAVVVALLAAWVFQIVREAQQHQEGGEAVHRLLGRFTFAGAALTPSHWAARGLQAAARGEAGRSLFQLALVWSNGLFAYLIAAFTAKRLYRRGYNRLATGGSLRRRYGGAWMDRLLTASLPFTTERTRLLIVKDFRTFRRDPQQWAQILIFTGLITLSITVARRIFVADLGRLYQNFISFFYVGVVGLLICIYTGRFVFPLFSLEGRKFWILGLLPIERGQLLWGKFAFASAGAVLIGEFLVLLSDLTLGMAWPAVVLHALTVAVLAFGLSGLSVGMGACLPNFRETDPSRIVSGFGGTMNLLVSLLFLLAVLALMAGPWYALMAWGDEGGGPALWMVWAGLAAGAAVGAAAVILPLRMGIRALREMEF
jgi:ABC-2 type transport system permease protein